MVPVIEFLRRPVAWGAVLLSYIGIIAAVAYAASVGATNADALRAEGARADARIEQRFHAADRHIARIATASDRDLCKVVINVHKNAKFRAQTERDNLKSARDYIRTGEDPNLRRRVRQTLPITVDRLRVAVQNVRATAIPATCKPYQKE